MLSECQFAAYDKFCEEFIANNIYSFNNGDYYNACGDLDIDEKDWENTEELRHNFEAWIQEVAPGKLIDCGFPNGGLSIYEHIYTRTRDIFN